MVNFYSSKGHRAEDRLLRSYSYPPRNTGEPFRCSKLYFFSIISSAQLIAAATAGNPIVLVRRIINDVNEDKKGSRQTQYLPTKGSGNNSIESRY